MEGNIIFDNVLELANPVNNCFKHKQCYFCPKMCFIVDKLISIFSYNICYFRSSEATGPGSPTLVVNGNHPTAAAVLLKHCYPAEVTPQNNTTVVEAIFQETEKTDLLPSEGFFHFEPKIRNL